MGLVVQWKNFRLAVEKSEFDSRQVHNIKKAYK
jgi:hypothetical protein